MPRYKNTSTRSLIIVHGGALRTVQPGEECELDAHTAVHYAPYLVEVGTTLINEASVSTLVESKEPERTVKQEEEDTKSSRKRRRK